MLSVFYFNISLRELCSDDLIITTDGTKSPVSRPARINNGGRERCDEVEEVAGVKRRDSEVGFERKVFALFT